MGKAIRFIFIALLVVCVLLVFLFLWATHPRSDAEIREVADAFELPEGWELTKEEVVPPSPLCRNWPSPCPSVRRTWHSDGSLPFDQLLQAVEDSGYKISHIDEPSELGYSNARGKTCSIDANFQAQKSYRISIFYEESGSAQTSRISFSVNVDERSDGRV